MREISPQTFHQPGHDRAPGPDPVPTKRRSTKPSTQSQEVKAVVSPTPQLLAVSTTSAPSVKTRKGKGCGSKKPRYTLTKALIKLALTEGYCELLEEREERLAEQHAQETNPNAAVATDSRQDTGESVYIVTCIIGDDGQEQMKYYPVGGKNATTTKELKAPTLEEILAEQKVHRLLADMKEVRVVINVGALVQAAKQNPKLFKLLQETKVPPKKSLPPKAKTDRGGSAVQVSRPSMGSSHRPFRKAKVKKRKFH